MFLLDSRKCLEIEKRPGTRPKTSVRPEADVSELWGRLLRGGQAGTGICYCWEPFQRKHIQHGQDLGIRLVRCEWGRQDNPTGAKRLLLCILSYLKKHERSASRRPPPLKIPFPQMEKKNNSWINAERVGEKAGNKKVVTPDRAQLPVLSTSWGAACSSACACSMACRKYKSPPVSQRLPTWAGLTSHPVVTDDPSVSPDSSRLTLDPALRPRK